MIKILLVIVLSCVSALLYRWGGTQGSYRWWRPVGVGFTVMGTLWLLFGFHWTLLLAGGASAGLSTTYFKKTEDAIWWNWVLVGFTEGVAILPWCLFHAHWFGFFIRLVFLSGAICLWSEFVGKDTWEERGRGFLIIISLLLLLLGV